MSQNTYMSRKVLDMSAIARSVWCCLDMFTALSSILYPRPPHENYADGNEIFIKGGTVKATDSECTHPVFWVKEKAGSASALLFRFRRFCFCLV